LQGTLESVQYPVDLSTRTIPKTGKYLKKSLVDFCRRTWPSLYYDGNNTEPKDAEAIKRRVVQVVKSVQEKTRDRAFYRLIKRLGELVNNQGITVRSRGNKTYPELANVSVRIETFHQFIELHASDAFREGVMSSEDAFVNWHRIVEGWFEELRDREFVKKTIEEALNEVGQLVGTERKLYLNEDFKMSHPCILEIFNRAMEKLRKSISNEESKHLGWSFATRAPKQGKCFWLVYFYFTKELSL
jgi:hypothetical protein